MKKLMFLLLSSVSFAHLGEEVEQHGPLEIAIDMIKDNTLALGLIFIFIGIIIFLYWIRRSSDSR